jgi:hypothetical protein
MGLLSFPGGCVPSSDMGLFAFLGGGVSSSDNRLIISRGLPGRRLSVA